MALWRRGALLTGQERGGRGGGGSSGEGWDWNLAYWQWGRGRGRCLSVRGRKRPRQQHPSKGKAWLLLGLVGEGRGGSGGMLGAVFPFWPLEGDT